MVDGGREPAVGARPRDRLHQVWRGRERPERQRAKARQGAARRVGRRAAVRAARGRGEGREARVGVRLHGVVVKGTRLHHGTREEAARAGRSQMRRDHRRAGRLTREGDSRGVPPERLDVALHPAQRLAWGQRGQIPLS